MAVPNGMTNVEYGLGIIDAEGEGTHLSFTLRYDFSGLAGVVTPDAVDDALAEAMLAFRAHLEGVYPDPALAFQGHRLYSGTAQVGESPWPAPAQP